MGPITNSNRWPATSAASHSYPSTATKDKQRPLITLICARACNTHLRWGFFEFLHTVCNEFLPWQGRCLFFLIMHSITILAMETAARFTSGIDKHIFWLALAKPSVSVKTARAPCAHHDLTHLVVSSKWHCTHYVAWIAGTHGFCQPNVLAVCHDFLQILQSLQHFS